MLQSVFFKVSQAMSANGNGSNEGIQAAFSSAFLRRPPSPQPHGRPILTQRGPCGPLVGNAVHKGGFCGTLSACAFRPTQLVCEASAGRFRRNFTSADGLQVIDICLAEGERSLSALTTVGRGFIEIIASRSGGITSCLDRPTLSLQR